MVLQNTLAAFPKNIAYRFVSIHISKKSFRRSVCSCQDPIIFFVTIFCSSRAFEDCKMSLGNVDVPAKLLSAIARWRRAIVSKRHVLVHACFTTLQFSNVKMTPINWIKRDSGLQKTNSLSKDFFLFFFIFVRRLHL